MAERQWAVIHLWVGGMAWKNASDEARQKAADHWQAIVAKWKAAGIEPSVQYSGSGIPGYDHCIIWKLKSIEQFGQMLDDVDQAKDIQKVIETYHFTLGSGS